MEFIKTIKEDEKLKQADDKLKSELEKDGNKTKLNKKDWKILKR